MKMTITLVFEKYINYISNSFAIFCSVRSYEVSVQNRKCLLSILVCFVMEIAMAKNLKFQPSQMFFIEGIIPNFNYLVFLVKETAVKIIIKLKFGR